ncbi:MAG TPA: hypothetical protein VLZ82_00270 [Microbacterium sp.]|nr:hypothetical protein [Microbacterium sp.]
MSSTETSARSAAPRKIRPTTDPIVDTHVDTDGLTVDALAVDALTVEALAVDADVDPAGTPVLAWRQADADVFVATNAGEFAGFVTVDRNAHIAHDSHSRCIGTYPTLAAARQALTDATRPPSRRRERLRHRILSRRR